MNHIFKWLNDDVQLTTKIHNIEEQFSNGYLFGELLSIFNQQLNFAEDFVNKNTKEFTTDNFKMLEPTMKELKIKFDSKIAKNIILKKNGAALEVLRQLKDALSKVNNPIDFNIMKTKGHCNSSNPIKKIEISKQSYRDKMSNLYNIKLKNDIKSQKKTDLEKHLKKFENFKIRQDEKIKKEIDLEERDLKEEKLNKRIQLLDKLQRNVNFYNDMNQIGTEKWKKNNKEKIERERREKEYILKIKNKKEKNLKINLENEKKDIYNEIERFEKKKKLKKNDETNKENNNIKINFDISNIKTILNKRELEMHSDKFRKQRDKRARKMIVDLTKTQKEIEIKKRENFLMNKLLQESKQEEEIRYEFYRCKKFKDIIEENRNLRNTHYTVKEKHINNLKLKKEMKALKDLNTEYKEEVSTNLNLLEDLNIKNNIKNRDKNYKLCEKVILNLLNLSENCYEKMEDINEVKMEKYLIHENNNLFKNFLDPIKFYQNEKLNIEDEIKDENLEMFIDCFVFDYIKKKNYWKLLLDNKEEEKRELTNKLGDILLDINNKIYEKPIIENNVVDFPDYLPLKIWILGPNYSGKETISKFLRDKFNLKLFSLDNLIKEKISNYDIKKINDELKKDELYNEISSFIFKGEKIPDEISSKFLINEIKKSYKNITKEEYLKINLDRIKNEVENKKIELKKDLIKKKENSVFHKDIKIDDVEVDDKEIPIVLPEGFIIHDYPHTYEQSLHLEKEISNFIPKDQQKLSQKKINKKFILKFMDTNKSKIIGTKKQKSGLDVVILFELENENLFNRAFGNVVNTKDNSFYHLELNPPSNDKYPLINNLEFVNNASDSIHSIYIKKSQFDINKVKIKNFYNKFKGINEETLIKIIDCNRSLTDIITEINNLVNDLYEKQKENYLQLKINSENLELNKIKNEKELKEKNEEDSLKKVRTEEKILCLKNDLVNNENSDIIILKEVLDSWKVMNDSYFKNIKIIFKELFESKNYLLKNFKKFRSYIINLLNLEDNRNVLLINLQEEINKLILDNQDLIERDTVKNELYNKIIEYCATVYSKSLKKTKVIKEENQKFKSSQILEKELLNILNYYVNFINEEIKLNIFNKSLLNDYYKIKDINLYSNYDREVQFVESKNLDNIIDTINNTLLEIFNQSKTIINEEIEINKNQKDSKNKNKKNAKDPAPIDEDNEILKELKNHSNEENIKSIKKLELILIFFKNEINFLIEKFDNSNKLMFNVIESSLINEKHCINNIKNILCSFIENECPIQTEINLYNKFFTINQKIWNFILKKDTVKDEIELKNDNNFLIDNILLIKSLLDDLKDGENKIETKYVLNFFTYIMKYNEIYKILPKRFENLTYKNFENLIKKLNFNKNGFIQYEQLITYIILFNSEIIDGKTNEMLKNNILNMVDYNNNKLTLENFIKIETTFDYCQESSNPFKNSKKFNRVSNIKNILYNIFTNNSNDEEFFDYNKFCNILAARNLEINSLDYSNYFDLMFN